MGRPTTVDGQIEAWQPELKSVETEIGRLRYRQIELIRRLDRFQVDTAEGGPDDGRVDFGPTGPVISDC